jgi:hypothetical protein
MDGVVTEIQCLHACIHGESIIRDLLEFVIGIVDIGVHVRTSTIDFLYNREITKVSDVMLLDLDMVNGL